MKVEQGFLQNRSFTYPLSGKRPDDRSLTPGQKIDDPGLTPDSWADRSPAANGPLPENALQPKDSRYDISSVTANAGLPAKVFSNVHGDTAEISGPASAFAPTYPRPSINPGSSANTAENRGATVDPSAAAEPSATANSSAAANSSTSVDPSAAVDPSTAAEPPSPANSSTQADPAGEPLSEEEKSRVHELKKIDAKVKAHEAAHMAASGGYARGGANFSYTTGPDGRRYATGGEVQIDTSPVPDDPPATVRKMQIVRRAALAPAEPSPQDRAVAASASASETQARREMTLEAREESEKPPAEGKESETAEPVRDSTANDSGKTSGIKKGEPGPDEVEGGTRVNHPKITLPLSESPGSDRQSVLHPR